MARYQGAVSSKMACVLGEGVESFLVSRLREGQGPHSALPWDAATRPRLSGSTRLHQIVHQQGRPSGTMAER